VVVEVEDHRLQEVTVESGNPGRPAHLPEAAVAQVVIQETMLPGRLPGRTVPLRAARRSAEGVGRRGPFRVTGYKHVEPPILVIIQPGVAGVVAPRVPVFAQPCRRRDVRESAVTIV